MNTPMKLIALLAIASLTACEKPKTVLAPTNESAMPNYTFERGFASGDTAQRAYDDSDLNRAIGAYKFFYPTVSGEAIFRENLRVGVVPNKVFATLEGGPKDVMFTLNSDTPYGPVQLDLANGPMVVELPPGPLICVAIDVNQLWVADLGVPGPTKGVTEDKVVFLPPGYTDKSPAGYRAVSAPSNSVLLAVRSLPVGGDVAGANARIKTVKVHPLKPTPGWPEIRWLDLTGVPQNNTPLKWEDNLQFWQVLAEVINREPANPRFHMMYGQLASLGIAKGQKFTPDARITAILEKAAKTANAQMRVASFNDRRPDRIVWPDRKWEWAALRYEDGDFNTSNYADLHAREKWFYQATGASPAMFKRDPTAGSLYWLGARDNNGNNLDGGKSYKLTVPQPVPGKLFWSVTVYDTYTRSQIITDQGKAALRSLFELKNVPTNQPTELYFGPTAPAGHENEWIKTIPDKGWFVYFRVYGPQQAAFDGSWKPGDFEEIK